ncbi:MotA/TolQ/ExbB proton channel family protein [Methanosphaera sp. ISO3-F5]|uniref:MotA/TolQ/ExbB proton channel family protein n=1 Tax=Methanosphaera sp. ISO3-F5 TaxID=1452353 RepID=UPI002B25D00C|nr:MotA/TolQ/ExbB proton channel family protein [Methanosphaera sp. ISO3-F5]WQH65303.1 MotA/TolQ/ExbB proton channel family protein [Methanosphaera sp. ISO3-F5]
MISVPGGEVLTGTLDLISQSLTIPVLIILLIIFIISVVTIGAVIAEYSSRKEITVEKIKELIYDINNANTPHEIKQIIENSNLPKSEKKILDDIASSESLTNNSREILARKLVENEEEKTDKKLRRTDIITRIGPTLGLMGTLIPLGPGLAALGSGDINTLASSLTVAFNTTIVGIGSGALSYFIGKIRGSWYEKYLSDLDALSDAILDNMNNKQKNNTIESSD